MIGDEESPIASPSTIHCPMNRRLFSVPFSFCLFFNAAGQCEGTEIAFISTTAQWGEEMGWELYHQTEDETTLISSFRGEFNGQTTIDT